MKKVYKYLFSIICVFILWFMKSGIVEASIPALWIQPPYTAWDNIYGCSYDPDYYQKGFDDGRYLSEILSGNLDEKGVEVYLDFGYFTEYVDMFKSMGYLNEDYQLPQSFYTYTKTGGGYKSGIYTLPYITTDCPEAMARQLYFAELYTTGITPEITLTFYDYVPRYIREQNGEICIHDYEMTVNIEATCNSAGEQKYVCSICGNSYTVKSAKMKYHMLVPTVVVEPTCAKEGLRKIACRSCDYSYTETIEKIEEHKYLLEITKEPTCVEEGIVSYTCMWCGDYYELVRNKKSEHTFSEMIAKEPTCTEEGERRYACDFCDENYAEIIDAKGHILGAWEVVVENGYFTEGEKIQKCNVCGEILNREIIKSKYPIKYLYIGYVVAGVMAVSLLSIIVWKIKKRSS